MSNVRNFVRSTWIGRLLLIPWRMKIALGVTLPPVGRALAWSFRSREHHNFTYELDELSVKYLTAFVAVITGKSHEVIEGYLHEIRQDKELKAHIVSVSRGS